MQWQITLQEFQVKKAEEKKRDKLANIMNKLKPHAGPCSVPSDVDQLLTKYTSVMDHLMALKAVISFQKLVLGHTSPHLKLTGSLP